MTVSESFMQNRSKMSTIQAPACISHNGFILYSICNILGLYAASYDLVMEWAVIKGISSFADGNKATTKSWQPFASAMAASVVYNMFKHPVVLKHWSHIRRTAEGIFNFFLSCMTLLWNKDCFNDLASPQRVALSTTEK